MLGDLVPLVAGAALAFKRRGEPRVAMTFLGEGAFSVGDTHEGLNLAAVWQVPAVFVIQANRYSYSTPVARQMVNTNIAQRIYGGWSIPAERVDGTDALAVLETVRAAVERARNGDGPQAVEALTVRMHGHAAHDDSRYVPAGMREEFAERFDPVERLAARLALDGFGADAIDEHARSGGGRGRGRPRRGGAGARARPGDARGRRLRGAAVGLSSGQAARASIRSISAPRERSGSQSWARRRWRYVRSMALTSTVAVSSISTSPDRAVGDPVGEQALDRVDVALPRVHLVVRTRGRTAGRTPRRARRGTSR